MEFRIGDMVEFVENYHSIAKKGHVGTVVDIYSEIKGPQLLYIDTVAKGDVGCFSWRVRLFDEHGSADEKL